VIDLFAITDDPAPPLGDQVGALRRPGIAPAEEVQVGPRQLGQIGGHSDPRGLALGAVDETGADLALGDRVHGRYARFA